MNIDVEKYLLVGPLSRRDVFFEKAQKLGIVEFINTKSTVTERPAEIETFIEALHVLRKMVPKKEVVSGIEFESPQVLARHIVEINQELEQARESLRALEKEIARIEPFGNFSLEEIKEIEGEAKYHIQFFFGKGEAAANALQEKSLIHVNSAYGLEYFVSINKEKSSYPGLIEMHFERSYPELLAIRAEIKGKIDENETTLGRLAHHKKLLKRGLFKEINQYHLEEAKGGVDLLLEGEIFASLAWIPKNKISLLQELADAHFIHVEMIRKEEEDKVPTYLENKGAAKIGEDLVGIYDTPSPADRDPSLWVFFAFAIFFSVIVADAGYGVFLLAISSFLFYKFRKKGALARRLSLLGISLSIGCIIWGVLTFSFFGIEIPPDKPIQKYSLTNWVARKKAEYVLEQKGELYQEWVKHHPEIKDKTDPKEFLLGAKKVEEKRTSFPMYEEFASNFMLELAIFMGSIHILLSFARYIDKNWSGLGWILFIIGGYLYFPILLHATSIIHYIFGVPYESGALLGKYLLFSGIGLACVLAVIQKRLGGLSEAMNAIQVFADVMSYLRLYALSLAGMVMASTFDNMGMSAPIYVGPFIILAGHAINFVLALMGGLIHGLRLNFIEWYHYSFEGGGKPFNPLSNLKGD